MSLKELRFLISKDLGVFVLDLVFEKEILFYVLFLSSFIVVFFSFRVGLLGFMGKEKRNRCFLRI